MKTSGKLALVTLLFMLIALSGRTQNSNTQKASQTRQGNQAPALAGGRNYVDNDNNGVCDNYSAGKRAGKGLNFVDKNGDGICDQRPNGVKGKGGNCKQGNGSNRRTGQGCCGRGPGFNKRQNLQSKS